MLLLKMTTWTGPAAAAIVGCPYSNVNAWDKAGVVKPDVGGAGPGTRRQFTFQNLIALSVAAELLRIDVPRKVTKLIVAHVTERGGLSTEARVHRSAGIWILSDGKTAWEIRETDAIGRLRTSEPVAVYAVPLRPIVDRLCARIANPPRTRAARRRRAST